MSHSVSQAGLKPTLYVTQTSLKPHDIFPALLDLMSVETIGLGLYFSFSSYEIGPYIAQDGLQPTLWLKMINRIFILLLLLPKC